MPQKFRRTPEEWIAAVLMTLVVVLLGVQVFMRFVLDRSPSWLEEVARFAFVWAIYFGFVIAVEKGRHIRVTLQIRMLSPFLWQKIMLTMADVAWIVFNVVGHLSRDPLRIVDVRVSVHFPDHRNQTWSGYR